MLKWISITKRLPKITNTCLRERMILFYRYGIGYEFIYMGWFVKRHGALHFVSDRLTYYPLDDVSHWAKINKPRLKTEERKKIANILGVMAVPEDIDVR